MAIRDLQVCAACALALPLAPLTVAQETKPAETPPLLRGPKVVEEKMPGTQEAFVRGSEGAMRDRVPDRVIEASLRRLQSAESPEDVRLTENQINQIRDIQQDVRVSLRDYTEAHAEEVRRLTRLVSARSDRPRVRAQAEAMEPMSVTDSEAENARRRLEEIRAGAPTSADAHARIWRILTEPQRAAIEADIARFRTEMEERMTAAYLERRMRNAQGEGAATPPVRPLVQQLDFVPEQLRQRIAALPPEQRERLIQRLRERHAAEQAQKRAAEPRK